MCCFFLRTLSFVDLRLVQHLPPVVLTLHGSGNSQWGTWRVVNRSLKLKPFPWLFGYNKEQPEQVWLQHGLVCFGVIGIEFPLCWEIRRGVCKETGSLWRKQIRHMLRALSLGFCWCSSVFQSFGYPDSGLILRRYHDPSFANSNLAFLFLNL